jgi:hypothetical protein
VGDAGDVAEDISERGLDERVTVEVQVCVSVRRQRVSGLLRFQRKRKRGIPCRSFTDWEKVKP